MALSKLVTLTPVWTSLYSDPNSDVMPTGDGRQYDYILDGVVYATDTLKTCVSVTQGSHPAS